MFHSGLLWISHEKRQQLSALAIWWELINIFAILFISSWIDRCDDKLFHLFFVLMGNYEKNYKNNIQVKHHCISKFSFKLLRLLLGDTRGGCVAVRTWQHTIYILSVHTDESKIRGVIYSPNQVLLSLRKKHRCKKYREPIIEFK